VTFITPPNRRSELIWLPMTEENNPKKKVLMDELLRLHHEHLESLNREAFGGLSDAERYYYEQLRERIQLAWQQLSEVM